MMILCPCVVIVLGMFSARMSVSLFVRQFVPAFFRQFFLLTVTISLQDSSARTRFGTLMLLLHWVEECPGAVATLLNNNAFVPYILELVEHTG